MGATETWLMLDAVVVEVTENDGAVFVRKGTERHETKLSVERAVLIHGKEKVAKLFRDYADRLEKR